MHWNELNPNIHWSVEKLSRFTIHFYEYSLPTISKYAFYIFYVYIYIYSTIAHNPYHTHLAWQWLDHIYILGEPNYVSQMWPFSAKSWDWLCYIFCGISLAKGHLQMREVTFQCLKFKFHVCLPGLFRSLVFIGALSIWPFIIENRNVFGPPSHPDNAWHRASSPLKIVEVLVYHRPGGVLFPLVCTT